MKQLALIVSIIALAAFIAPKAEQKSNLNIKRIQTDIRVTFTQSRLIAGAWFCEAVR